MYLEYEDTIGVVEQTVQRLLQLSGITSPPVDPILIAKKCRITYAETEIEGRRGQNMVIKGYRYIDVHKDDRLERKAFSLAHEILEMELPKSIKGMEERHKIAIIGTPCLLMPTSWFKEACKETDFDIFELKEYFNSASHEAIAWRTLVFAPAIVTIIDNKKVTNRKSSIESFSQQKMLHIEKEVAEEVLSTGDKIVREFDGGIVHAYPLLEEKIKRVILRTVPTIGFD